MNTFILLVESQVILNFITGFKSKNILKCIQIEYVQGAVLGKKAWFNHG